MRPDDPDSSPSHSTQLVERQRRERKHSERSKRPPFANGYTLREAARLVDLSQAQVQSWVQNGFLEPRRGARGEFRFTFQDLVLLRTAKELTRSLSTRKVRRALQSLRQQLPAGRELTSVRITTDGQHVLVRDGNQAWNPESGQTLFDFDVSDLAARAAPLVHETALAARDSASLEAEDWYELGSELETCEPQEARHAYGRALEIDPRHLDAHVNLGRLEHEAGQFQAAEFHYRTALEIEPDDAVAAYNLGVLLEDLRRTTEAVTAYQRAIASDPTYADAHFNLAHLYEALGRAQEAVRHLQIYRQLTESA
jgi:tetratricopeptide (TPR) repeat protein